MCVCVCVCVFDSPPLICRHTPSSHKTGRVVSQLAPQAKCLVIKSDKKGLFSFLSSLPISVLRNLELEANKLYDRANKLYKAALLTRCYVQHFLSPYIDSEVNHKRHFIKIPFINKGIEFIDLHSIFKDNSVISSIPNYFNNSETPIICYKYNKPIRSTIFNFNKIVNDLDIDSNTPAS